DNIKCITKNISIKRLMLNFEEVAKEFSKASTQHNVETRILQA
ncbi:16708_t:CDS:1, partial [Dentiscutata heterogama]